MKTINFSEDRILEKIGKYVGQCENITQFFESYPMIHYISGIPEIDECFAGKKFAEFNYNHVILIYEKAIVFHIYRGEDVLQSGGIWKEDLIEIIPHYKQTIEIWSVNKISKSLKSGGFGFINALAGAAADKIIDQTKNKKYKEVEGVIYEICINNSPSAPNKILVSCESSSIYKTNAFFNKYLACKF